MSTGPKYHVNIEGTNHEWPEPTITTEQIAQLGGWKLSLGVIEIDKDNNERTLSPGEVVELKPGQGFSKKIRWKRGIDRIDQEVCLLVDQFGDVDYERGSQWIRIPEIPLPEGWNRTATDVAVQIPPGYPGAPPYGIYVPAGLRYRGKVPKNYKEPAANAPPFPGQWGVLSWTPSDGRWRATADVTTGANLLRYVRGFDQRFAEGV